MRSGVTVLEETPHFDSTVLLALLVRVFVAAELHSLCASFLSSTSLEGDW